MAEALAVFAAVHIVMLDPLLGFVEQLPEGGGAEIEHLAPIPLDLRQHFFATAQKAKRLQFIKFEVRGDDGRDRVAQKDIFEDPLLPPSAAVPEQNGKHIVLPEKYFHGRALPVRVKVTAPLFIPENFQRGGRLFPGMPEQAGVLFFPQKRNTHFEYGSRFI